MSPEIAKRLEALGAETAEDRRLAEKEARQKEALDYYREHDKAPSQKTPLGRSWNDWTTRSGQSSDPKFIALARAAGWIPRIISPRVPALVRKEEALDYYRKNGEAPSQKTPLGRAWNGWTSNGKDHDPEFIEKARILGWLPLADRVVKLKKEALDYYRKHGKILRIWATSWKRWAQPSAAASYDPEFSKAARALGWKPRGEK